jgi:hypothetical protein
MAVPAVFAKGALVSGTGALTPSIPTGTVDGDDFFLVVEDTNEGTRTAPTDWTQLPNSPQTVGSGAVAGSVRLSVFHRRQVGSTAPASPSVADMGNHAAAMILVVRGGASGTPWEATAGGTSAATTSFSAPGVTTTSPNALILHFAATDKDLADTALLTSVANANLSNLAVIHQEAVATGVGGGIFILTGRKVSAGATGTTTATADASEELCYLTIALTGETVSGLPSGVYWNPVDCAANIALTNSYLTATAANDFWLGSVRANQAITGKKFWRIVLGSQDATDTYVRVGAAQETVALTENLETAVNSTTSLTLPSMPMPASFTSAKTGHGFSAIIRPPGREASASTRAPIIRSFSSAPEPRSPLDSKMMVLASCRRAIHGWTRSLATTSRLHPPPSRLAGRRSTRSRQPLIA